MAVVPSDILKNEQFVKGILEHCQYQPAGVDLTISKIFSFASPGTIDFDNSRRDLSLVNEIPFENGKCFLRKGAYKIRFNEIVSIPNDVLALVFPRSSLLRCGASLLGAVWDPGYEGRGESLLVVFNDHGLMLYENARIAQLVFIKLLKPTIKYSGAYQKEHI